jgi:ATP-dependent 26S proteasome regulatory subunit
LEANDIWGDGGENSELEQEILQMSNDEIRQRITLLNNDVRIMKSEIQRTNHDSETQRERIKDNNEKVKLNKQLPYLVGNIVEVGESMGLGILSDSIDTAQVLELEEEEEEGGLRLEKHDSKKKSYFIE